MQEDLNTYVYKFNVEVKINKHYYLVTLFKIILGAVITLILTMVVGSIITVVIDSLNSGIAKFASVIIIFSVFIVIMSKLLDNKYNDYMCIDDNLNVTVRNIKKNKEFKFNLHSLYRDDKVKLIDYTWSHRVCIVIKGIEGYRVCITGDKTVNNKLIPKFKRAGLKVKEINDEPSD